nr:YbaK/EbsC family protein [uncultured Niameybacter sp.]
MNRLYLPYPEADAKNLFIRDDKKQNYYLITIRGDKRVNLKEFRKVNQTRPLSFASEKELMSIMGLIAGSVTPLGILNDKEIKVKVFLDKDFYENPGIIGIHPNDNTATVWLKVEDLVNIIKEHGNVIEIVPT